MSRALGSLGGVDHHADSPPRLTIAMAGRQYRLVISTIVNGEAFDTPVDERLFGNIAEARAELRSAITRAQGGS